MIIGIDVGTHKCGIGILDYNGKYIWSIQYTVHGDTLDERLMDLAALMEATATDNSCLWPLHVFIEEPPHVRNVRTHAVLHQAVGVVKMAFIWFGGVREFCELNVKDIKLLFTGSGRATKELVQRRAKELFGLDEVGEDEADALATAYAGWRKMEEQNATN